jgi:membrane-bound ClpP family serine protease
MVNKACFRKSVVHDFVWILAIVVALAIIGIVYLMLNALTPILTPFGTAFNWMIILYVIILFLSCFLPFLGNPKDLKTLPTGVVITIGCMFGGLCYMLYNISQCHYTSSTIEPLCMHFPDITMVTIGWIIAMFIFIPVSMAYARCRGE